MIDIYADNTEILAEVISSCIDGKWIAEKISKNPVYRITRDDGYSLKAKFFLSELPIKNHELLQDAGVRVPKIEHVIQVKEDAHDCFIVFTEWIVGECYLDSIRNPIVQKNIPPDYYIELGKLLASINNVACGNAWLTMTDVFWGQFVLKDGDIGQLYLIDTAKIIRSEEPTRHYHNIFSHEFTSAESKSRFVNGYKSAWKKREPTPGERAAMLFLGAMRKKNEQP